MSNPWPFVTPWTSYPARMPRFDEQLSYKSDLLRIESNSKVIHFKVYDLTYLLVTHKLRLFSRGTRDLSSTWLRMIFLARGSSCFSCCMGFLCNFHWDAGAHYSGCKGGWTSRIVEPRTSQRSSSNKGSYRPKPSLHHRGWLRHK